jgi:C1A family cysteine protease
VLIVLNVLLLLLSGDCACCYAIVSVAALEGQIFRQTGALVKLSDQQIIDCSQDYGNNGCSTGNFVFSYKYIIDNGIAAGRDYPYKMRELGSCLYNQSMQRATMFDYRRIKIRSDEFLMNLVYNFGPVPVGVYGSLFSFLNYQEGVYNDPECAGTIDHAMLLVGFGTDPVYGDFWLLKNSYGSDWGENGFIRMTRTIQNFCNITEYVVLPIFQDPSLIDGVES